MLIASKVLMINGEPRLPGQPVPEANTEWAAHTRANFIKLGWLLDLTEEEADKFRKEQEDIQIESDRKQCQKKVEKAIKRQDIAEQALVAQKAKLEPLEEDLDKKKEELKAAIRELEEYNERFPIDKEILLVEEVGSVEASPPDASPPLGSVGEAVSPEGELPADPPKPAEETKKKKRGRQRRS